MEIHQYAGLPKDFVEKYLIENIIVVDNINFYPLEQILIKIDGKIYFNTYKRSNFMIKADEEEDKEKDYSSFFPAIENLLRHICLNDEIYNYVLKWYAWKVQHPEIKVPTALIFQGEKGTGKSFFQEQVIKTIFGHLWTTINQENMEDKYNLYMFETLLVNLEEAISDDTKEKISQKLKNLVSDTTISIRKMNNDPFTVLCFANLTMNTNTHKPIKIEEKDRRYTIIGYQNNKIDTTIIRAVVENKETEVKAFYYYLKHLKVEYLEVSQPLKTDAKEDIRKYNMNSLEHYFDEFDFNKFKDSSFKLKDNCFYETQLFYKLYISFCGENGYKNIFSRNKFTMELKQRGFSDKVIKEDGVCKRYIKVLNDYGELNGNN
jgi:putative DNA primase/helicase